MLKPKTKVPDSESRQDILKLKRNAKMARSTHAYVRGNTIKFYDWLEEAEIRSLPHGPAIWICGDCHTGNLGPIADAKGKIEIQIRDLDQTVIGNPAHDLIRLGLSLATAARGSALPGVTTINMIEALFAGYAEAFDKDSDANSVRRPEVVRVVMREAVRRSWKHLARERLDDVQPTIPFGNRFWPISKKERAEIVSLFEKASVTQLATSLRGRPDTGEVTVLDAAYWVKGCSSLGRLRYAVLLDVDGGVIEGDDLCIMDIKEGVKAAAPRYPGTSMPRDHAERVVEGARHLSPHLGERMRAASLQGRPVILRELLPQDLKLEIEQIGQTEAMEVARYLALVVGQAHARQMDKNTRRSWLSELRRTKTKSIDAPLWLWSSIVELVGSHETGYLEHCRRYALAAA
ncbi:DUF2252 domain-containing protein [Caballeronia sp. LP006]|uniref:DUF2252 domain-containing protein n=1 Tax=unclassified Caballeronia TaxID=2646786 RepID=UPI001FD518E6|nr:MULTISPECIES: DUF2252 domain-containing protein [unclassified Caballeronia]MDR5773502.1 DUF2252 domain-containing protein [Caballeronia sp. LZ002]MDR5806280.1 DUF2252 domain-containing protein [Caballeronia sp. LZ001]MDR5826727.1 DUF2252 domain-containing protein [Caballeronia sp. LP006]MDR5848936.1 DUF2252 domain-containing protein [Caballeronia sp. LZ003]